jgi:hypothetical protein
MKNTKTWLTAIILFVCFLFAGCGKKTQSKWIIEQCDIEGLKGVVQQLAPISEKEFYVLSGTVSENEVFQSLFYVNLDRKKAEMVPLVFEDGFFLSNVIKCRDNCFAALLLERNDEGDERVDSVIVADQTGTLLVKRALNEITHDEGVIRLISEADGKLWLITSECLYSLDENLICIATYESEKQIKDAVLVDGKKIVCLCTDDREKMHSNILFQRFNTTNRTWEENFTLKFDENELTNHLIGGNDNKFFLLGTKGIYKCDENGNIVFFMNCGEVGVSSEENECLIALPKDEFLVCTVNYEIQSSNIGILRYKVVEHQESTIVIGSVGMESRIAKSILEYNKTHPTNKVEIKEYQFENNAASYNDACNRLYADILGGNGPDIIYLSGLDSSSLIKHGFLENLDSYFENDPEIRKTDMIPSFCDAISVDGHIFYIAPEFSIMTMAGKSRLVGESMGWTMNDLYDLWKKNQFVIMDEEDGITFRQLIKGMAQYENIPIEDYKLALEMSNASNKRADNSGLKDGTALLGMFGITSPSYIQVIHSVCNDEEITLKGFPDVEGSGAMFSITNMFGISSKSEKKELAWDVIRMLMTKEYQSISAQKVFGFPSRLDCFEEEIQEYKKDKSKYNFEKGTEWQYGNDKGIYTVLSEKDAARIKETIYETKKVYIKNSELEKIICEEAGAFFSGDKDSDIVCELIKNRMELYRMERK